MDKHGQVRTGGGGIYVVLFAVLISFFFIFETTSWSSLSIIGATGALLLVYILENQAKLVFRVAPFHNRIILFILYSFMTAVWSWSSSATISRSVTVLLVFLCMCVVYMIYESTGSLDDYYKAIMLSGVIVSMYAFAFIGLDNLRIATEAEGRMEGDAFFANINAIGMWMSVCVVVFVHRIVNTKFRWWYLLGILPMSMIAISQSRTALIEAVLGIVLVFVFKAKDSKNVSRKLGSILVGALVVVGIFYAVTNLEMFSGLYNRMRSIFGLSTEHKEGSMVLRNQMIEVGLDQFKRTPIFGIGFGSSHALCRKYLGRSTYLHNNFVEVLASGGIVGFLLYYSMHWYILKNFWKARVFRDNELQLCLLLIFMHLLGDYGTVSFYKKPTYIIITLGFLAVSMAKRRTAENES